MNETPWIHRATATRLAMAIYNEPRTRETDALVQAMSEVAHTELRRALEPYREAMLALCAQHPDPGLRALWNAFFLAPKETDDVDGDGGDAGSVGSPDAGAASGDGGAVDVVGRELPGTYERTMRLQEVFRDRPHLANEISSVIHGAALAAEDRVLAKAQEYARKVHMGHVGRYHCETEAAAASLFSAEDLRGLEALCSEPGAPLPPRGVQSDGGAFARALGAAITRGQAGKGP